MCDIGRAVLRRLPLLHDPPALHHEITVGKRPGEVEILLDDHDRDPEFGAYPEQGILDLLDDVGLDSFGRFIEQQQRRLACQGPADRQLLLLSPRQHARLAVGDLKSEEHTSELQSLMRNSYAVFCLKKKKKKTQKQTK